MKKISFSDLIILENDDYILINKPPYVATLADRNDKTNISDLAKEYWEDAQVCHRLDKETSGVLAVAKTPEAYRNLSIQFEKRTVSKEYHAVVDGVHQFQSEVVDAPLMTMNNGRVRIHQREGKEAKTTFDTLHAYRKHTLVSCKPLTGRMHQIRVHLSALEASITGDEQYGGEYFYLSSIKRNYKLNKWEDEQPIMKRFALHARTLEFDGVDGDKMKVEADYPKDMRVLVQQLERNK